MEEDVTNGAPMEERVTYSVRPFRSEKWTAAVVKVECWNGQKWTAAVVDKVC